MPSPLTMSRADNRAALLINHYLGFEGSQLLVKLISGFAAILVIGSMLGFFRLLKLRSEQENSNHKTPASTPIVPGTATFLMDATSGKVLIDSNSHARLPIAGIAKIMTAVVAIE